MSGSKKKRISTASGWQMLVFGVVLLLPTVAQAARISELVDTDFAQRAARFFTFQDASLRDALLGSMLLGGCCGMMGAFLVVRKLALMGDSLSHAVLPGVALGFLWHLSKDPVAIFIGATLAGLLGAGTVQLLRRTTRHQEDAALGFVLAAFFSIGICLFTMIQNLPGSSKSGLDKFMFGQAAALGREDVMLLAVVAVAVTMAVTLLFKEYRVTSFDPGFARSIGLPVQALHYSLMLLLAFAIVSALQAVGIVLVSAMLVIPAAAAYLLTDRLSLMVLLGAAFGVMAAASGAFFSFAGSNLPTGPFMVLSAAAIFAAAFLFAPRHGWLTRWWRERCQAARVRRENLLKAMYHALEQCSFITEQISVRELAERRRQTLEEMHAALRELERHGLVTVAADRSVVSFTPAGWQRACEIVRNHRLWELYLTRSAQYAADHVHDDAESVEHLLSEATVMQLEKQLNYARRDPHGKLIPGLADIQRGARVTPRDTEAGGML